jgi:hypothetical protein
VIITSNYQSVAYLGAGVAVEVFTEGEALTFLAAGTGQADAAGAGELGRLPLALAQAAAISAAARSVRTTSFMVWDGGLLWVTALACQLPGRHRDLGAGWPLQVLVVRGWTRG